MSCSCLKQKKKSLEKTTTKLAIKNLKSKRGVQDSQKKSVTYDNPVILYAKKEAKENEINIFWGFFEESLSTAKQQRHIHDHNLLVGADNMVDYW